VKIVWGRSIGWNIELNKMVKLTQPAPTQPAPTQLNGHHLEPTIIEDGADCYPWVETFIWWPTKSVMGNTLFWVKGCKRRVWVMWGTGFHMEPETQYATVFELLQYNPKVMGRD
jgi:hypothetical protein